MKRKMKGVLGIGLTFVLLASLMTFAIPVSAAAPLPKINSWTQFTYPLPGATGGWFWDPSITGVGPMAKAINGDLYAYVAGTDATPYTTGSDDIFRSIDGGRTWSVSQIPNYYTGGPVVDMVCSSLLEDVIYVTDGDYVYKSSDNAGTWTRVAQPDLEQILAGACGTAIDQLPITCLDVGYDAGNKPYVFIGVQYTFGGGNGEPTPTGGPPDVLYIDELAIGATWKSLTLSCYVPGRVYTPYAVGVTPDFATAPIKLMVVVTTTDSDGAGTDATHVISSNLGVCGWTFVAELFWDCDPANPFQINHSSRIGYPDDYVDGRMLFVGVTAWNYILGTNTAGGDVYSVITFPVGLATDLNVAGSSSGCIGLTNGTNICGLDVCGDTADAAVIAGAMDVNITQQPTNVYTSIDGGWTWVTSLKDPTGEDETWVQWVGDDCGATALAATNGCDCAVSITCGPDVGVYWNQASLISTCIDCVLVVDHSPGYYQAGVSDTLFMLTQCDTPCGEDLASYSVFRYVGDPAKAGTSSPAHPWERVFSSRLYEAEINTEHISPDGDPIEFLVVSPDFLTTDAVFIGNSYFEIWRSLDAGCSWFKFAFPCAPRPEASAITAVDKETVVVGGNGVVYKTTRHGTRHWNAATVTGAAWAMSFDFDGNNFLMGDSTSKVFISTDGALTWAQVDAALGGTDDTSVAFDPGYAVSGDPGENTIYASAGEDIYRCVIDPILPMVAQAWYNIYNSTGADFWGMATAGDTALYVGDRAAVSDPTTGVTGALADSFSLVDTAPLDVGNNGKIVVHTGSITVTPSAGATWDAGTGTWTTTKTGASLLVEAAAANTTGVWTAQYSMMVASITTDADGDASVEYGANAGTFSLPDAGVTGVPAGLAAGGMVRSLNPTAVAPEFERVTDGLAVDDELTGLPLTSGVNGCPNSNVLWATDVCGTTPERTLPRVWFFEDTLATPVIPVSPANGAKLVTTDSAILEWEKLCTATAYDVELWYFCPGCLDRTFVTVCPVCCDCAALPCVGCSGETCCKLVSGLFPGTTYYWRARVCEDSPMLSKWSATRSFTTALGVVPELCSPVCGGQDIILTTNFSWTEVPGAAGYEVEIATNEDFSPVIASGTPKVNAWAAAPELDYSTTYYWRVRAVRDGVVGAWTVCIFSTEEAPPEEAPYVWICPQCGLTFTSEAALLAHIDVAHAPPATPAYIWIIIGIGAALVIAVLLLIVRTRRAA